MISFIIGVFVGGFIGMVLMALLAMARDPEPPKREPEQKEPECKGPTILWAVGNICRWKGKIFEIKKFSTTTDNQTVVQLIRKSSEHNYWIWVPIEELEAVDE